jgi:hypothetical protein
MNNLKQAVTQAVLEPDRMYSAVTASAKKPARPMFRVALTSLAVLALTVFGFTALTPQGVRAVSIVAIDINPSFQLKVDADGKVVEVRAINKEAKTIEVSDLVGWLATDAVKEIILRAQTAGFIDLDDDTEDYVLITTAPIRDEDQDATDELNDDLEDEFDGEDETDDVSVILMKATKQQAFEAEGKKVPLGLYVINGMVQVEGELMSVSEFMKGDGNLELLEPITTIIPRSSLNAKALIEKFLDKLDSFDYDTAAFRSRLANPGEDLLVLKADVMAAWDTLDKTKVNDQSGLTKGETAQTRAYLNRLIRTLERAGVDVEAFKIALATQPVDYVSLEAQLVAALELAGIPVPPKPEPDDEDEDDDE